ncbi:hypothetical protein DAPPUDRAFT_244808 [Daphnia pulex]|uniref:Uncharacterized protein n=1 Tax=Daphnia pulex TaxID=6669 RepID=E9GLW7_DAPPU|nr:hypothetical protein DAPPUDRAFT_244808 [Daphnia pulex]|eukprot:EFX79586.1 hypothetical protein DAPPUDRAFT_244808 [Daphnia pulex]
MDEIRNAFTESLVRIPMTLADSGAITNMLDEGVAQPFLVTTSVITLASEIVHSILEIDDIVNVFY